MKRHLTHLYLLIGLFVLLMPTGCTVSTRRQLDDIESYLQSRPDSALVALDALNRRKLRTPGLWARHALLYSVALDKNYIDIADDSIARVAVDWYRFHKPLNYRMMAWYYLGRVQQNAGNLTSASLSYEEALQYASGLKDNHYLGIINFSAAYVWLSSYDGRHALHFNEAAIQAFSSEGHHPFEVYARIQKAEILYSLMRFDESWAVFDSLLSDSNLSNQSRASCLRGQAGILTQKADHPERVPLLYKQAQQLSTQPLSSREYGNLALSYARLHQPDSARVFRNLARESAETELDSSSFVNLESCLAILDNDYKLAYDFLNQAVSGQNRIVYQQLEQSVAFAQKDFYKNNLREKTLTLQNQRYRSVFLVLILTALLSLATVLLTRSVKARKEEKAQLEETIVCLAELKDGLTQQQSTIQSLIATRLGFIKQIYDLYFQLDDRNTDLDNKQKALVIDRFKQELRNLRKDKRLIKDIADLLDTTHDNIISDLKKETNNTLKEEDFTLLTLFF